ncbi:MAG: hypothetical protein SCI25_13635 [Desulfuromonadales bacterium]|nr:hypothetical protein [Desulfuromonadales bacterium]
MAGLVCTIGNSFTEKHNNLHDNFTDIKELPVSLKEIGKNFSIYKYCRKNEKLKDNIMNDACLLFAIGTPTVSGEVGLKALYKAKDIYEKKGINSLCDEVDGNFIIVIYDKSLSKILLITDPSGIINCYSYCGVDGVALSTSSMALSRTFPVTLDYESVYQFLRIASICDNATIYNEIKVLDPASVYYFEVEKKPELKKMLTYWAPPFDVDDQLTFNQAVEKVGGAIRDGLEGIVGENIVCDLTGGFDSRLVLSGILANGLNPKDLETFTFGPDDSIEVKTVKKYWEELGVKGFHLKLPDNWNDMYSDYIDKSFRLTDGEENIFNYAPILYAQEFKSENYNISMNGLGGELYRDFWWVQNFPYGRNPANIKRLLDARVLQYEFDYSIFNYGFKEALKEVLYKKYSCTNSPTEISEIYNTRQIDNIYFRQKIRRWAGRSISSSSQLIKTIAPLTFKASLSLGMSVKPSYKLRGDFVRAVIGHNSPILANLKMLDGTPCEVFSSRNFYKYSPLLTKNLRKVAKKISQVVFNKTILVDKTIRYDDNDLIRQGLFREKLEYENIITGNLFDRKRYIEFIESSKKYGFSYYGQLGNLITLERRIRNDKYKYEDLYEKNSKKSYF